MSRQPRSEKLSLRGMEIAPEAFRKLGITKNTLADRLGISRDTVSKFFTGKVIDRVNFFAICRAIFLEPKDVRLTLTPNLTPNRTQLGRWKDSTHYDGWFPLRLQTRDVDVSRADGGVSRTKDIHLAKDINLAKDIGLGTLSLNLQVSVSKSKEDENNDLSISCLLKDYDQNNLPKGIQLSVISNNQELLKTEASSEDAMLVGEFEWKSGECFGIKISFCSSHYHYEEWFDTTFNCEESS